ncbi:MAG TPA: OmpH family outer membrane protein [Thermoanaerobaculia bacterium]|nr:OmpH family outer membrane protein [Thermoanaerobaculia bacterium]
MKKFALTAVSLLVSVSVFAQTAPSRVAVIDVRKVLSESTAGKASFDRLSKMQTERAARAQKMNEELAGLESELKQKQMSLSQERLAELNKQFNDKRVALQRYAQDAERELGEARDRELAGLERQILPVINEVGKEMGFALIFNKLESGLVYASDAIDITDVVVKRFNGAAAAKAPAK